MIGRCPPCLVNRRIKQKKEKEKKKEYTLSKKIRKSWKKHSCFSITLATGNMSKC